MKKIRYDYIDVLKIIAILMVIVLHSISFSIDFINEKSIKSYISFFIRILCEGVPIFICVNGFLILNKELDLKKHLKKILKIFIVLNIWSIINIISIKVITNQNVEFKDILKNVLLTNIWSQYTGPLWFLQNLIMLYFIYPVLKVVHDYNKKIYNYLFIIVAIFTVGLDLMNNILSILQYFISFEVKNYVNAFIGYYNPVSNGSFVFFFMLGGYIFENKEKLLIKKNRYICIIIGIISILTSFGLAMLISNINNAVVSPSFNYCSIFMVGIIILLFSIFYNYKNNGNVLNKIIFEFGKNSLGIYLVHKIIIIILNQFVIFQQNYITKIMVPFIVLIISYIIVKIIIKIPMIRKCVEI